MTTTIQPTQRATYAHGNLRSVGAVVAGLLANVILSGIADQILHWLGVFPPWGQITYEPVPYALAVSYRAVFGVASGYIAARLAPRAPMRHALALGVVGTLLSVAGVVAAIGAALGPVWYPASLALLALPASWAGGKLHAGRGGVS